MTPKQHSKLLEKIIARWAVEYGERLVFFDNHAANTRIDRAGRDISYALWITLVNDPEYSIVAKDNVEGVNLITIWKGYKDNPYVTIILKDNCILATAENEDEKSALWLHCQLIFYFDQKLWSIQDV